MGHVARALKRAFLRARQMIRLCDNLRLDALVFLSRAQRRQRGGRHTCVVMVLSKVSYCVWKRDLDETSEKNWLQTPPKP